MLETKMVSKLLIHYELRSTKNVIQGSHWYTVTRLW